MKLEKKLLDPICGVLIAELLSEEEIVTYANSQHKWFKTSLKYNSMMEERDNRDIVNGYISKDGDVFVRLLNFREMSEGGMPIDDHQIGLEVTLCPNGILGGEIVLGSSDYTPWFVKSEDGKYIEKYTGNLSVKKLFKDLDGDFEQDLPGARSHEIVGEFPPQKTWDKQITKKEKAIRKAVSHIRKRVKKLSKE